MNNTKNGFCTGCDSRDSLVCVSCIDLAFIAKEQWVSVKDRLPEHNARYLVVFDNMEKEYCIGFSSFHIETKEFTHIDITHWMCSPEPPK